MKKEIEKCYPYRNRDILVIDLTKDEYSYSSLDAEFGKEYHGGRALAYKLWDEYVDWSTINKECLYVGAPIIISLGSSSDLGFSYTSSSTILSYSLESKSVVSFNFSSSKFVAALGSLGFSALVIKGRSRRLSMIEIFKDRVNIDLCESFHGLNTRDIQDNIKKASSLISISVAGEKCIDYASINIDSKNVGRNGIGAIFGSKNLKCIAIYNNESLMRDPYFDNLNSELSIYFNTEKKMIYLDYANKLGWAAIEAYKYRYDPRLWGLGSDLTPNCNLDWLVALALGSNLGIYDYKKVEILEECCLSLGLDPISVSNYLIWVLNAEKNKIINLKIDSNIAFLDKIIVILESLAYSKGLFSIINENINKLSDIYGFNENNFSYFNKELLPLDLRGLNAFSLAISIDDDTLVPWEIFSKLKKKDVAKALFISQIYREICESLGLSWKNNLYLAYKDGSYKNIKNKFTNKLCDIFAVSEGYKISEEDLFTFGKKSFFHRRNIEEKSKGKYQYSIGNIPIHFLIDSKSNYNDDIVSIGSNLEEYLAYLEYEKSLLQANN